MTSKVLSFHWSAIEPLIDVPVFTEAVKELAPAAGTPESDAQERSLNAVEKHVAAERRKGEGSSVRRG
ncbi:hypothetical protein [Bradyrhizobium genosp. SA-3]|uniref:hypothetical protein n=1 Tax=Bradyrhizobium genosp. SA-3 TaxID=508868 RepID=UPI0013EE6D3E|nr:hypothetical protein [Bradyrhizobium genosp. SA-3]